MLLAVLLLGAVLLERTARLPEPAAVVLRWVEGWLVQALGDVGLELPPLGGPETEGTPEQAGDRAAVAQALELLGGIPIEAERPRGYERGSWPHWLDADGDCLSTRQEVLLAESVGSVRLNPDGCQVRTGLWRDAYTGELHREPGALDVDHLVPLAEAHRSGGRGWNRDRRAEYANDVGDSRTLVAVGASANRAKGDQGPEDWLPPDPAHRCLYVAEWVAVKARWRLSMDERERVSVGNLLRGCAGGGS